MTGTIPPLNGTRTHPLSEHARAVLASLLIRPAPAQEINPGVVNRLLREALVDLVPLPSPYRTRRGMVNHLKITAAGRAAIGETAPGHTDLMISPDGIDEALAQAAPETEGRGR